MEGALERDRERSLVRLGLYQGRLRVDELQVVTDFSKRHPKIAMPLTLWDELIDSFVEATRIDEVSNKVIDEWIAEHDNPLRGIERHRDGESYRDYIARVAAFLAEHPEAGNT